MYLNVPLEVAAIAFKFGQTRGAHAVQENGGPMSDFNSARILTYYCQSAIGLRLHKHLLVGNPERVLCARYLELSHLICWPGAPPILPVCRVSNP